MTAIERNISHDLAKKDVGFVFRPYSQHSLVSFAEETRAALVVGDENPIREPERWRG